MGGLFFIAGGDISVISAISIIGSFPITLIIPIAPILTLNNPQKQC